MVENSAMSRLIRLDLAKSQHHKTTKTPLPLTPRNIRQNKYIPNTPMSDFKVAVRKLVLSTTITTADLTRIVPS